MAMPMQMDQIMGMMEQMKRMRQPDAGGIKPVESQQVPWRLGSRFEKTGAPSGGEGTRDPGWGTGAFNSPEAIAQRQQQYEQSLAGVESQIINLQRQLAMVQTQLAQAIERQDQFRVESLRQMVQNMKEQIAALQAQRDEMKLEMESAGGEQGGMRGGMSARTSGRSPGVRPYQHVTAPTDFGAGGGGTQIGRRTGGGGMMP